MRRTYDGSGTGVLVEEQQYRPPGGPRAQVPSGGAAEAEVLLTDHAHVVRPVAGVGRLG